MALRILWFLRQMSLVFSFANFRVKGFAIGFTHVESGPLVQNSYHAEKQVVGC
jgi:lipoate synthase